MQINTFVRAEYAHPEDETEPDAEIGASGSSERGSETRMSENKTGQYSTMVRTTHVLFEEEKTRELGTNMGSFGDDQVLR